MALRAVVQKEDLAIGSFLKAEVSPSMCLELHQQKRLLSNPWQNDLKLEQLPGQELCSLLLHGNRSYHLILCSPHIPKKPFYHLSLVLVTCTFSRGGLLLLFYFIALLKEDFICRPALSSCSLGPGRASFHVLTTSLCTIRTPSCLAKGPAICFERLVFC